MKFKISQSPVEIIIIAIIGIIIPILSNTIATCIYNSDFFFVLYLGQWLLYLGFTSLAVCISVFYFIISKKLHKGLRWLPLVAGYVALAALYWFDYDRGRDSLAGLSILLSPMFSGFFALLGFVVALIAHWVIKLVFQNKAKRVPNSLS